MVLKNMLQHTYLNFTIINFEKKNINNIILLLQYVKDNIKFLYVDGYKKDYCFILLCFIVDWKEQVFVIGIK